jgi:hypothetical protein
MHHDDRQTLARPPRCPVSCRAHSGLVAPALVKTAARPPVQRDRPDVPVWALGLGAIICLVFVGLVLQTFTGRPLQSLIATILPGSGSEQLADTSQQRAFYVPGSTVQAGQVGLGSRGQDRAFQVGDLVLLGAAHRLVRIDDGNRLTDVRAADGATLTVASLGAWNQSAAELAGLPARFSNGAWTVDAPPLQPTGAPLHVPGAPDEELTAGFRLVPASAGRIKRSDSRDGPIVRLRPAGRSQSLSLESWDPLPSLDNVTVTVQASVRASEGASLEVTINDVVDAAGTIQKTSERRAAPNEDEWLTLRVQRRVQFASPDDRYSVGILEVRNRDWLEIRDLGIYLGVLP